MSTARGFERPIRRYLVISFFFHVAVIAAAVLFYVPSPEPIAIEVLVILETGDGGAGEGGGDEQQQASQQTEAAPRPSRKPAAPPRKATPRPSPPKAAPAVREVAPVAAEPLAMSEAASEQAPAEQASGSSAAARSAAGFGSGQQTASGSGGGSGGVGGGKKGRSANDYLERVRAALAKHKKYPDQARKLKQEGTARIKLVLARDGTVLSAQIADGSGFPLLDDATLQMARDASPLPRVPDDVEGDSVRIALPVTFSIGFFGRF